MGKIDGPPTKWLHWAAWHALDFIPNLCGREEHCFPPRGKTDGLTTFLIQDLACNYSECAFQLWDLRKWRASLLKMWIGRYSEYLVTLNIILLGVGGTIYNTHTLKPFKELGFDSQRVRKLPYKLLVHFVNFAAKLVHTRRAISSNVINSNQEPVSGQACNPPIPIDFFFLFTVEKFYGPPPWKGP